MQIQHCTKRDFDQILTDIEEFWGSQRTLYLHNSILIHEFDDSAFVIRDGSQVVAYLFGFAVPTKRRAFVHLVAARQGCRRQGLASRLYTHFFDYARSCHCAEVKAITTPDNGASIAFHTALGFTLEGKPNPAGIPVQADYSGPGLDRVVFHRALSAAPQHPRHIIAVMGIVQDAEDRVLLIRSPERGWEPPGGQVEVGEDLLAALHREIHEESGIQARVRRLAGVYSSISDPSKLILTFIASADRGTLATSEESLEVGWFAPAEAVAMVTHRGQQRKLTDALAQQGIRFRAYRTRPYEERAEAML